MGALPDFVEEVDAQSATTLDEALELRRPRSEHHRPHSEIVPPALLVTVTPAVRQRHTERSDAVKDGVQPRACEDALRETDDRA
jgi:hypothetical protein